MGQGITQIDIKEMLERDYLIRLRYAISSFCKSNAQSTTANVSDYGSHDVYSKNFMNYN